MVIHNRQMMSAGMDTIGTAIVGTESIGDQKTT